MSRDVFYSGEVASDQALNAKWGGRSTNLDRFASELSVFRYHVYLSPMMTEAEYEPMMRGERLERFRYAFELAQRIKDAGTAHKPLLAAAVYFLEVGGDLVDHDALIRDDIASLSELMEWSP